MTMKEDIQPKKRSEKIIISISDETSEWLELYCKTNGIFYFPLEKIIGELCWVHNEQKTFGKIHVKTEL
ncbi:MAG: hypothetical protein BHV80_20380 [Phocaeicola vulgatus]|uniref:Uncharacterized protein n=1 Tax=Phocaeicola vulgatus TaxID=821 RepID=A0A1Q6IKA4_PHOVU|nr:MAG: hypothetical protein BHV80_20380 [Phocaeicola vulgatus]